MHFQATLIVFSVAATDSLFSEEQSISDKEPGMIDSENMADGQSEGSLVQNYESIPNQQWELCIQIAFAIPCHALMYLLFHNL